ncbi:MAG: hypothetical protein Q4C00_06210 [Bacillota bacterium]|nr:hypothetical protein [Bacillota bacterium]
MDEILKLLFILIWGFGLGLFYHIVDGIVRRCNSLTYILWPLGGAGLFFATAAFLFYLDKGAVGLYGFPIMVLGFLVYLYFLRRPLEAFMAPIIHRCCTLLSLPFLFLRRLVCIVLLPIGWIAQEAGVFMGWLLGVLVKLLPKRKVRKSTAEESGLEAEEICQ